MRQLVSEMGAQNSVRRQGEKDTTVFGVCSPVLILGVARGQGNLLILQWLHSCG